jgi:hypothetical protein
MYLGTAPRVALEQAIVGALRDAPPPASLDGPMHESGLRVGTPEEYARLIMDNAQMLSFLTKDPSKRDAFEAIKCGVMAMLGMRDRLPVDALTRLRAIVTRIVVVVVHIGWPLPSVLDEVVEATRPVRSEYLRKRRYDA